MIDKYVEYIKKIYPQISIKKYHSNDIGQNNDVIVLNDSLIFRFPKYQKGIERLKEETHILECVKNYISLPIPNLIYQSFEEMEVGKVFTGYKLIQGSPLWKENFQSIEDNNSIRKLASQLVVFLEELHSISIEDLKSYIVLKDNNSREEMSILYKRIQEKLFPFIRKEARQKISYSFENFLANEFGSNKNTLIHGDFGASNILWNPSTYQITGIIDFGASRLGDPAYDFAGILSSYGEDFYNMCIGMYPNGTVISERVKFYKSTFALQEALHGIENNDSQAFEDGIKNFR